MASTLGQRLRKARQSGGLTQKALAVRLGVTQPLVANWESGKAAFDNYRKQIEKILGPLTNKNQPASAVTTSEVSSFGDWVRENRDKAGLSVPELAKKADISSVAIYPKSLSLAIFAGGF
jgi:transcriptional regulator with XRE-family HTH domain